MREKRRCWKLAVAVGLAVVMSVTPAGVVYAEEFTDVQTEERGAASGDISGDADTAGFSGTEEKSGETVEDTSPNPEEETLQNPSGEQSGEIVESLPENPDGEEDRFSENNSRDMEKEEPETLSDPDAEQEVQDIPEDIKEGSPEKQPAESDEEAPQELTAPDGTVDDGENRSEELFTAPDGDSAAMAGTDNVKSTEVTLYALDTMYAGKISMPNSMLSSYQIKTSGSNGEFSVISGLAQVDKNGRVTPGYDIVQYVDPDGNVMREGKRYYSGESMIQVKDGTATKYYKIIVKNYATYYAEQKMDDFLKNNIRSGMSDHQKLKTVAEWIAHDFSYDSRLSGYTELMIYGGGNCWASTSAVNYMCRKLGFTAYSRNGSGGAGAGNAHVNSLILAEGKRYLVDCGFAGDAPRTYTLSEMNQDFSYVIQSDDTLKVYQYEGLDTHVVVPDTIDGKKVTALGVGAIGNGIAPEKIESVTLPDTLTSIGDRAFCNCTNLKSVTIPKNVSSVGKNAFLTDFSKPGLTEIKVASGNPYFSEKNGVLFDKSGKTLIAFPTGRGGSYQIPDGVTGVGDRAFYYGVNLSSVTVPSTVKTLGTEAFENCTALKKITLSEGLVKIGDSAFQYCSKLDTVTVPASVKQVGKNSLQTVYDGRFLVLTTDASWGENVFLGKVVVAGRTASTVQKYMVNRTGCTFVKLETDNKIALMDNWFGKVRDGCTYNGKKQQPAIEIKNTDLNLKQGVDYTLTYVNNINAGKATVRITGKGLFKCTLNRTFVISPKKSGLPSPYFAESKGTGLSKDYKGKRIEPEIVVEGLAKGRDYTVTYKDNNKPGKASVVIGFMGNYKGTDTLYFNIFGELPKPQPVKDQVYTGKEIKPEIVIPGLVDGKDYVVLFYYHNVDVGVATAIVLGAGYYDGEQDVEFNIVKKSSALTYSAKLSKTTYTCTGKAIKPAVSVTVNGKKLKSSYYKLTYKNNKNAGVATVRVKGTGKYSGLDKTLSFKILPPKTSLTKVSGFNKTFTAVWKKNSQASGYQIQYAANSKFTSGRKLVTIRKPSAVKQKITGLKSKKTYYVRVRAYKKVGKTVLYGSWSTVKKVKA